MRKSPLSDYDESASIALLRDSDGVGAVGLRDVVLDHVAGAARLRAVDRHPIERARALARMVEDDRIGDARLDLAVFADVQRARERHVDVGAPAVARIDVRHLEIGIVAVGVDRNLQRSALVHQEVDHALLRANHEHPAATAAVVGEDARCKNAVRRDDIAPVGDRVRAHLRKLVVVAVADPDRVVEHAGLELAVAGDAAHDVVRVVRTRFNAAGLHIDDVVRRRAPGLERERVEWPDDAADEVRERGLRLGTAQRPHVEHRRPRIVVPLGFDLRREAFGRVVGVVHGQQGAEDPERAVLHSSIAVWAYANDARHDRERVSAKVEVVLEHYGVDGLVLRQRRGRADVDVV